MSQDQDVKVGLEIETGSLDDTARKADAAADALARMAQAQRSALDAAQESWRSTRSAGSDPARSALEEEQRRAWERAARSNPAARRLDEERARMNPLEDPGRRTLTDPAARQPDDDSPARRRAKETADRVEAAMGDRKALQEELVRRGVLEDPEKKRKQAERSQAEREAAEKYQQHLAEQDRRYAQRTQTGSALVGMTAVGGARGLVQGGLSMLGPEGAAAAAVMQGFVSSLGAAAKAIDTLGDKSMSSAQKFEKISDEMVWGAKELREFKEALSGTSQQLRDLHRDHALAGAEQSVMFQRRALEGSMGLEASTAEHRAQALAGVRLPGAPHFDRSTVGGEIARQEYLARQPAADAKLYAEAEVKAARGGLADAEENESRMRIRRGRAQASVAEAEENNRLAIDRENKLRVGAPDAARDLMDRLQRENRGPTQAELLSTNAAGRALLATAGTMTGAGPFERDKVGRVGAALEYGRAAEEQAKAQEQLEESINKKREARNNLAAKQLELGKANVAALQAEAQIGANRADTMRNQNRNLGSQNVAQRRMTLEATRIVKRNENRLDMVPHELLQRALAGPAGPAIEKMIEQRGANTRERGEYQKLFPDLFRQEKQADLDNRAAELAEKARQDAHAGVVANAGALSDIIKDSFADLLAQVKIDLANPGGRLQAQIDRINAALAVRFAQGG